MAAKALSWPQGYLGVRILKVEAFTMHELLRVLFLVDARVKLTNETLLGIAEYVKISRSWLIEKDISHYLIHAQYHTKDLRERQFDGVVCLCLSVDQEPLIRTIIDLHVPVLARGINMPIPGAINIITDNVLISEMAADHLLTLGLNHFAFFGVESLTWSRQRRNAFKSKIAQAGNDVHIFEFTSTEKRFHRGANIERLLDWLTQLPKPIGVMACNDDFGLMLLQCCQIGKISVPEELAVIGVDNDETVCNLCVPPLSSVARDAQKAGFEGARIFDRKMRGKPVGKNEVVIKSTHIETRQSTDMLAIKDTDVIEALQFMRKNILYNTGVDDVIAEVSVSRRNLDHKFTRILGRTVHEEITRMRIEKICELLTLTNLPISQIASDCGFHNPAQLGNYFLRHKGVSPGQYRKQHLL